MIAATFLVRVFRANNYFLLTPHLGAPQAPPLMGHSGDSQWSLFRFYPNGPAQQATHSESVSSWMLVLVRRQTLPEPAGERLLGDRTGQGKNGDTQL